MAMLAGSTGKHIATWASLGAALRSARNTRFQSARSPRIRNGQL